MLCRLISNSRPLQAQRLRPSVIICAFPRRHVGVSTARSALTVSSVRQLKAGQMSDASAKNNGKQVFDRSKLSQTLNLQALKVQAKQCQILMKTFTGYTFNKPRTRCIVADTDSKTSRLLLLAEHVVNAGRCSPPAFERCDTAREPDTHTVLSTTWL